MRLSLKAAFMLAIFSIASINQVEAYCARCNKIEAEREEEQAAHPQKAGYYDDEIGLHKQKSTDSSSDSTSTNGLKNETAYSDPSTDQPMDTSSRYSTFKFSEADAFSLSQFLLASIAEHVNER